jgi:hypothetical protein
MRDDWKHRLERNLGPRLVLGSGVLFGLVMAARYALGVNAAMRGVNFHVYYLAAAAALHGEPLYAVAAPGFPGLPWVYPPVVSVAFAPYLAVGDWQAAFALHTLTGVAAGAATGVVLARFVARQGRELTRTDRALVVAFGAVSVHAVPSLFFGNVNPHLAFALAAGIAGLDEGRSRLAGVGFALPAVVKVFPAAFGLWLVSRRDWRAVGAAVATGAAAAAASFGAFGVDAHVAYVREALLPRLRHEAFAGGLDPAAPYVTLRRPLSVAFPDAEPTLYALGALAVVAPVVAYCWTGGDRPTDRVVGLYATVAGALVVLPSYLVYLIYLAVPLVPLAYLVEGRTARRLVVAGGLLVNATVLRDDVTAHLAPAVDASALAPAVDALATALTVASPPLYGVALTLAGCVVATAATRE